MSSHWQARREKYCIKKIANFNDSCTDESQLIECEERESILQSQLQCFWTQLVLSYMPAHSSARPLPFILPSPAYCLGRTPFTVAALVLLPLSSAPGQACERGKRHQAIRQVSFIHSSIKKIEVFKFFSPWFITTSPTLRIKGKHGDFEYPCTSISSAHVGSVSL